MHGSLSRRTGNLSIAQIRAAVCGAPAPDGDAERAALRLARDSALLPNTVGAGHFDELRKHFGEPEIVELLAVCSLFGFLNRWNDSVSTELEGVPRAFAEQHLGGSGWQIGDHE